MAFDESKFQRDERGRFSSTGKSKPSSPGRDAQPTGRFEGKAKLPTKERLQGSLKDWAGLPGLRAPGVNKTHSGRTWDAAKEAFGPMAGRMSEARMRAYDQADLPGVDQGQPSLAMGTHYKAKSQGDPMGKRIEDTSIMGTAAKDVADQAFRDIASRYPNVSAYLKKVPLSEVQTRAAMAEWVQPNPEALAQDPTMPTLGYHILPVAGQYTSKGASPEGKDLWNKAMKRMGVDPGDIRFGHANKPGDLMLATNDQMPLERVNPGRSTPDIDLEGFASPRNEKLGAGTPFSMGATARNQRDYALCVALHELGHHVMLHDTTASEAKHAREEAFAEEHPDAYVSTSKPTKGEKVADIVKKAYLRDAEESKGPFTGYAGASPNEWFAEAFLAFHVRPDFLKERSPIAYRTVKKVLRMRGMQQPDEVRLGSPPLLAWGASKRKASSQL